MSAVPIKISGLYADLAEVQGMLSLRDQELILEFQTQDTVLGILKSSVREKRIPLKELQSAQFKRKFTRGKLMLRALKMTTLADIPGSAQGEVTFVIDRKDRERAEQLACDIELALAELQLKALDQRQREIDRV